VPPFDFELFKKKSLDTVEKARRDEIVWDAHELAFLKSEHSWEAAGKRFLTAVRDF